MYGFAKRGPLWIPERERVQRYFPKDLQRFDRYQKRFRPQQAIAFVQKAFNTNTSGTTIAATFGSAPTQNNLLIACVASNDGSFTSPSGWTDYDIHNTPDDDNGRIAYKVAGAAESSTVTFTAFVGNTKLLSISEFSGLDTATPRDVTNQTARTTTVNSLSTNSVTPNVADELLIGMVFVRDATVSAGSFNSSFILLHDLNNTTSFAMYCAYLIVSSIASYSTTASWTQTGTALGGINGFKIAAAAAAPIKGYKPITQAVQRAAVR